MAATIIRHKSITTRWDDEMPKEDMIRMNAAANGRWMLAMLFAMNMILGSLHLAFASVLILALGYVADTLSLLSYRRAALAAGLACIVSTGALIVATWLSF